MAAQIVQTLSPQSNGREDKPESFIYRSLDKFFTLTLDMFFIVSFEGYFQQVNPMCEKTLGYTTEELLSQRWIEGVHPEDQPLMSEYFQRLTIEAGTIQFENRYCCKDGSYKWLLWNATSCPEQQSIYAVARDNTECRRAEAAQRESEECLRLLVEGVKDYAIIMLDPLGRIVSWNTGAERIHQYHASEIVRQSVSCFYPREDIQRGIPEQGLYIAALQSRFEEEGWRVRKDGSKFWANVVTTALRTEDGHLRGFARVTRDITERKIATEALKKAHDELEQRVRERTMELTRTNELLKQEIAEHEQTEAALRQSKAHLKKQAQQLEAEKQHATSLLQKLQRTQAQLIHNERMSSLGQLIAGIAHEINNPVGFIYCNLDYASCYIKDLMRLVELYSLHYPQPLPPITAQIEAIDFDFLMADMPKLMSSMKVGATRLRQIVLSLQNFLRAEQTEMRPIDLHEGLDSTLLILRHRLKESADFPEIRVIKEYGSLPLVECFAGQINQVFMHLLTNAIDVLDTSRDLKQPREIIIRTGVEEISIEQAGASTPQKIPYAVIRIADTGPGMSEEVYRRLFDPFFTTKPSGKATGLGLSISYQIIVDTHGGQLTCVSEPGQGAQFIIALPIQQTSESSLLPECA